MEEIITFIFTAPNPTDFTSSIYNLRNILKKTNGVVLHDINIFKYIFEIAGQDFQFRIIIHAGMPDNDPKNIGDAGLNFLGDIRAIAGFTNVDVPFISRKKPLFYDETLKKEVLFKEVDGYTCFLAGLANNPDYVDEFVKMLPVFTKGKITDTQITRNKSLTDKDFDFVIQTALYEDEFAVYETDCNLAAYPRIYNSYIATFKEHKKALADGDYNSEFLLVHQIQMGLVDAAIHATQVITKVDPTFLLMSGVCGGKEHEVNLYDVIIPSIVYDYSTGKIKDNKLESLEYEASANKKLIKFLKDNSGRIIHNMRSIINPDRKKLLSDKFKIVIDEFACGPWVIKTEGFLNKMVGEDLQKHLTKEENDLFLESIPVTKISKGIKGLEMESYSLLRTSEIVQKAGRFTIVAKAVMDFTNEYKKDGPNGEVKSSAAYVSYLCVRAMMPILLEFKSKSDTWTE